ncbi:MAG: hypothetical protein ACLSB9_34380 [Hydrogeniiclostridium mannosilyticum]
MFYYREFFKNRMSTENLRQVGRSIAEQIDILQHMDSIALQAVTNTIIVD